MRGIVSTIVLAALAAPAFGQGSLNKVSGDGQLAQIFYAFTQPLVVRALDASGKPAPGRTVTWSDTGGLNYRSDKIVTTDANGLASLQFVPGGDLGPGIPYKTYKVTAASEWGNVQFTVTAFPFQAGSFNPQPTVQLLKPGQSEAIAATSGQRVLDAVRAVSVTSGGLGVSPGLPIQGVGLTVHTVNQDPQQGIVANCAGTTALSGANGEASCDLEVRGPAGTSEVVIDIGGLVSYTRPISVTAPGPAPVILSGDNQSGLSGQVLPLPLVARVISPSGSPAAGTAVTWSAVTASSVTLMNTIGTSDANGIVSTNVYLGPTPGVYQIRVAVGAQEARFQVTIVGANAALAINTASLPSSTAGVPYSQSLAAIGGKPPYQWAVTAGALPAGLTLDAAGLLSGTPAVAGTYSFTVRATDSAAATATRALSLTINTGLAITTSSLPNGAVGGAYSQSLAAAGGTPPYVWSLSQGGIVASTLPAGLALTSAGIINGTPIVTGNSTFTVRVVDASGREAYRSMTLTIGTGAVISTTTLPGGAAGAAYSQTLAASGGSQPYTWTLASGALPAGLALSPSGVISGTPSSAGQYSFSVRLTDGASNTSVQAYTVTITASAVLGIPAVTLPNANVGAAYSQTLAASGGVAPLTWTLAGGLLPQGLTLSTAGVLSGTPAAMGISAFVVRVTDSSGASALATFSLTVVSTPRVTTTSPLTDATVGTAYAFTLAATGGAAPYTWSIVSGTLPAGLLFSTSGLVSGTPTTAGISLFTVQVRDSTGATATAALALAVNATAAFARSGIISQLASGGGWKTTLTLLNLNSSPAQVRVALFNQDGTPLELPAVVTLGGNSVTVVGSTIERTLSANGSLLIESEAAVTSTVVGWADVHSTVPVSGYAIFRQRGADGRDSEGTSPLENRAAATLLLPFDNQIGFSTGLALVNLSTQHATVTVIQRDQNGVETGRDNLQLAPSGHTAFSLPDKYPALSGLRGVVELQSNRTEGVTALGLRFNPTLSFTSIPVVLRQ